MQSLKLLSAIFLYQQMIALTKLRKRLFVLFEKLFFVVKIFKFLYFPHSFCFRLSAVAQEVIDVINWLNENLKAHCV